MPRRHVPPFETEITHLADRGVGVGAAPDGRPVRVRGASPGSRVAVTVFKRKHGELHARLDHVVRPPADGVTPPCALFRLCGGCTLQDLGLDAQRRAKAAWALDALGPLDEHVTVHPPRGAPAATGYRNKVELSFGTRRYLDDADQALGVPHGGRFLGFHAPGRFDRVVDGERCELVSEDLNALIATTRALTLHPDAPPPWDVHAHEGFWRHLVLREGQHTGEILVAVHTSSQGPAKAVEALAEALLATPLPTARLVGVLWLVGDRVADVVEGETQRVWGQDHFTEELLGKRFRLSLTSFFQTSTDGADVLYRTLGEATGRGGTLVDLYSGVGSIGICLADHFERVVGIEEVAAAVADATANAEANGVRATYTAAKVEDALSTLVQIPGPRRILVDPPRAGLHPKVAEAMAAAEADVLVYVACHAPSLGRDRTVLEAGGWRLVDVWTVDLFPQTGHVELVARFVR